MKDLKRSDTDGPLQPAVSDFADDKNVSGPAPTEHNSSVQDLESPATSSSGGDSLVVRQILQDISKLGRLPKELKKPKTGSDVAEYRLAVRMGGHDLRARAEHELRTRFFKRHLKAF